MLLGETLEIRVDGVDWVADPQEVTESNGFPVTEPDVAPHPAYPSHPLRRNAKTRADLDEKIKRKILR